MPSWLGWTSAYGEIMTLLPLSLLLFLAPPAEAQDDPFPWRTDLAAATREAEQGGLPLLIVFR